MSWFIKNTYKDEEKQVKKLMEDLAAKKAELKSIKELEC